MGELKWKIIRWENEEVFDFLSNPDNKGLMWITELVIQKFGLGKKSILILAFPNPKYWLSKKIEEIEEKFFCWDRFLDIKNLRGVWPNINYTY